MTKTLTFAATHFSVAFTVAWLLTGDVLVGGVIALIEPAVNTVAYFFHEKLWQRFLRHKAVKNKSAESLLCPFNQAQFEKSSAWTLIKY